MHTENNYGTAETRQLVEEKVGVRTMPQDRIDEILEAVEDMEVELAEDPIAKGPRFLIRQIAKARNYMSEVQRYREELQNHITRLKRKLNDLTSEYDLRYNAIRIKNEDIKDFGAAKDRDAACEFMLQDLKVDIDNVRSEITELESVLEAVNNRFENLKQTGWDIRKQRELIEDELKLTNSDWSNVPEEMTDEISEEDVEFSGEDMEESIEADVDREDQSDESASVGDIVEGVDMGDNKDIMKGPDLGTNPSDDQNANSSSSGNDDEPEVDDGMDEDEISDFLEDQDFDL